MPRSTKWLVFLGVIALAACGKEGSPPPDENFGANPVLPAPERSMIPTAHFSTRRRGQGDGTAGARGFKVYRFAEGLKHPRWLYVLPNGDVLVRNRRPW
jgi:glucose/arabinose dehydrogenase